jgi:PKD domain-containing protein
MRTNVLRLRFSDPFWRASTSTTNGPVISHACSAEGTYRATLTVNDNDGQTGQAEVLVEVTGPPVAGQKRVGGNIQN